MNEIKPCWAVYLDLPPYSPGPDVEEKIEAVRNLGQALGDLVGEEVCGMGWDMLEDRLFLVYEDRAVAEHLLADWVRVQEMITRGYRHGN